jgi:hypothetical protein
MASSQGHLGFSECAVEGADIFSLAKSKEITKAFSVNSETPFLCEGVSQHRACPYSSNCGLFVVFFKSV